MFSRCFLTSCVLVTLGNVRETKRFTNAAWRLACLLPQARVYLSGITKSFHTEKKQEVWHEGMSLIFQNYNTLLKHGMKVKCSDGEVRDLRMILGIWAGDQPEIETCCCLVGVSDVFNIYTVSKCNFNSYTSTCAFSILADVFAG
jgi:hypothetical protein